MSDYTIIDYTPDPIQRYNATIEHCRKEACADYVCCKGWSPTYGPFMRLMREYGYNSYWIATALAHPESGCKNVSYRRLNAAEIEAVAQQLYVARKAVDDRIDAAARAESARRTETLPADAPETPIGQVEWEYHMPGHIHCVSGATGQSPKWVRQMAALHWPEAKGIQVVRVRVECSVRNRFAPAEGVTRILLDLSPDHMGIDATHIGSSNSWAK